jgi:imidazolonepropionase-like amidohydrolase
MRFDPLLDSVYVLGSLWGALPGPPVCTSSPDAVPGAALEIAWSLRPRVPAAVTAFVDVNVVPMDTERVLPSHTVLVEGGRITALGPAGKVNIPTGATRIDGRGKYLIPGLANMHEHGAGQEYNNDRSFAFLANGVTAMPGAKQTAGALEPHRYRSPRANGLHINSARNIVPKLDSVAAYVAGYKAAGYDFISLPRGYATAALSPAERAAVDSLVAAARRMGLPLAVHAHTGSFGQMLRLGAASGSSEHLTAYFDTLGAYFDGGPRAAAAVPLSEIQALAVATQRAGAWNSPTLNCLEERRSPKKVEVARQLVKALQDAGAGLLLGADADGIGGRGSPSMVHSELAAFVRAGLTPYQALRTGTRNVAEYFGKLDESGTVAVGKRADLVLLYGNPLQDVWHTREPAGVMLGGQWLDRTALDQRLLAPPTAHTRPWVVLEVVGGPDPKLTSEQKMKLAVHSTTFGALTDSLEQAKAPGAAGASTARRLLQRLAAELGAMRALLTPEQHAAFDPAARVWLREQARRGYQVTIPGVAAVQ